MATPFKRQDSGMLSVLAHADCLILRAPNAPELPAGAPVDVVALAELGL